jgi:CheY-like chemotaxis protein
MKQLRIYLVDDDQDDLDNLCDAIAKLGCASEVKTFGEPNQLLNELKAKTDLIPDLIVFDHQTPGFKSVDAISLLRQDERFAKTAIAVYSGRVSPHNSHELKAHGVDIALAKGFTMQEISAHVALLCDLAAQRK